MIPSVRPEAGAGVVDGLSRRAEPRLSTLRRPLAAPTFGLPARLVPAADHSLRAYSAFRPDGDQRVFADPAREAVFVEAFVFAITGGCQAAIDDLRLFGRDWGFRTTDGAAPVRWWRGDAAPLAPLAAARAAVSHPPDADLVVCPGESHLGGFAKAGTVQVFLREAL